MPANREVVLKFREEDSRRKLDFDPSRVTISLLEPARFHNYLNFLGSHVRFQQPFWSSATAEERAGNAS